jgi:putative phosphoribosyl transferase
MRDQLPAENGLFNDRQQAGRLLAERLARLTLERPLVLAIPRGGIEVAAEIAHALGAELDVVLARKLRCPVQPELALGAVVETGEVTFNHFSSALAATSEAAIEAERQHQLQEIARRRELYRRVRPQAPIAGRSVIITDDGIATGSTMIAAIGSVRAAGPREIIVAVPVGSPERVADIAARCERMICLIEPEDFMAVGQFYRSFDQVSDERVLTILAESAEAEAPQAEPQPTWSL